MGEIPRSNEASRQLELELNLAPEIRPPETLVSKREAVKMLVSPEVNIAGTINSIVDAANHDSNRTEANEPSVKEETSKTNSDRSYIVIDSINQTSEGQRFGNQSVLSNVTFAPESRVNIGNIIQTNRGQDPKLKDYNDIQPIVISNWKRGDNIRLGYKTETYTDTNGQEQVRLTVDKVKHSHSETLDPSKLVTIDSLQSGSEIELPGETHESTIENVVNAPAHIEEVRQRAEAIKTEIEAEEAQTKKEISDRVRDLLKLREEKQQLLADTQSHIESVINKYPDQFPNDTPQCPPVNLPKTPSAIEQNTKVEVRYVEPLKFKDFAAKYAGHLKRESEFKVTKGSRDFLFVAPKMWYNKKTLDRSFTMTTSGDKARHMLRSISLGAHRLVEKFQNYKTDMKAYNAYMESYYNDEESSSPYNTSVQETELTPKSNLSELPRFTPINELTDSPEEQLLRNKKIQLSSLKRDLNAFYVNNDEKASEINEKYKAESDANKKEIIRQEFIKFNTASSQSELDKESEIAALESQISQLENETEIKNETEIQTNNDQEGVTKIDSKSENDDEIHDNEDNVETQADPDHQQLEEKPKYENKYKSLKEAQKAQDLFVQDKIEFVANETDLEKLKIAYERMIGPEGADDFPQYVESEEEFELRAKEYDEAKRVNPKSKEVSSNFNSFNASNPENSNNVKMLQLKAALKLKIEALSKPFDLLDFSDSNGVIYEPNARMEIKSKDGKVFVNKLDERGEPLEEYQVTPNYDEKSDKYTLTTDGRNNVTIFDAKKNLLSRKFKNPLEIVGSKKPNTKAQ